MGQSVHRAVTVKAIVFELARIRLVVADHDVALTLLDAA
jgi:hypothetical protein